jgi:hypothetical protein
VFWFWRGGLPGLGLRGSFSVWHKLEDGEGGTDGGRDHGGIRGEGLEH